MFRGLLFSRTQLQQAYTSGLKFLETRGSTMSIFTTRSSYASAVLRMVILSVCPSVVRPSTSLSNACFVTKRKKHTADNLICFKSLNRKS